jgi:8-oxo-dGTP diphosphatase
MPVPTDPEKRKYMFTDDIKFLQKALVFHPEQRERFLALRRSPNDFARPNDWDLPGGNVLYGMLHEDSLRSEIKEETQLEVSEIKPIQLITKYDEDKPEEPYIIFAGHHCNATTPDVTISEEHTEYKWVTREEFYDLKPAQFLVDLIKESE